MPDERVNPFDRSDPQRRDAWDDGFAAGVERGVELVDAMAREMDVKVGVARRDDEPTPHAGYALHDAAAAIRALKPADAGRTP